MMILKSILSEVIQGKLFSQRRFYVRKYGEYSRLISSINGVRIHQGAWVSFKDYLTEQEVEDDSKNTDT
jgi:hypothetical protein